MAVLLSGYFRIRTAVVLAFWMVISQDVGEWEGSLILLPEKRTCKKVAPNQRGIMWELQWER